MDKTKFTKGKWEAIKHPDSDTLFYINNEELRMGQIATCYYVSEKSESEANAKLIAAAPEMFEMLKELKNRLEYYMDEVSVLEIEELLTKITE
jgi:hypothetical protein